MTQYSKTLIANKSIWDHHNGAKKQRLTITIDSDKAKFNVNDRKEAACYKGFKLINKKDGESVIDARFYSVSGRVVNCCLWINLPKVIYTRGSGRAGGWGYERSSSALEEAISNAGVDGFPHFGGSGCNREALLFLARVLGVDMKKHLLVEFFG